MAGMLGGLLNILLSFVLPIIAIGVLMMKRPSTVLPAFLGAIGFMAFQLLLPILDQWLKKTAWHQAMRTASPYGLILLYAILVALFQEGGRWIVMRFLMPRSRRFVDGVAFGVGYGGVGAVLVTGVGTIATLFLLGGVPNALESVFTGIESFSMLLLQITWSTLVLKTIVSRKPWLLLVSFLSHVLLEFLLRLAKEGALMEIWLIETLLFLVAAAALILVQKLRKNWRAK